MGVIRFLLACGIVLCHSSLIFGYTPLSGSLAVQCFYIISGFYMSLIRPLPIDKATFPSSFKLFFATGLVEPP